MRIFLLSFLFCAYACAMGAKPVRDKSLTALMGHDITALVEGCGNQLVPGFTLCRVTEGSSTLSTLNFVGPTARCQRRDSCVDVKVFDVKGELAWGGSIPKGQMRVAVPWSKLVNRKFFELSDRGLWIFTTVVYWTNDGGLDEVSVAEGEIQLRVIAKDYIPLNNVENDANFVWKFITRNGEHVKMTTGMRTFVSLRPEKKNI